MSSLSPSKKYLKLFAGCVPVQGARRTVVVDTQRGAHFFIPNDLHTLLGPQQCLDLPVLRATYPQHEAIIDQYVTFLLQQELAFFTDEPERFPVLDLSFRTPEPITNAIIDLDAASDFDLRPLVAQLDALKCKALQLRLSHAQTCPELTELLALFGDSLLRSIEVYVPYDATYTRPALEALSRAVPRLTTLYLHGAAANAAHWYRRFNLRVVYVQPLLTFPSCCGVVAPHYFTHSIGHLTEAVSHNSCLNRKIAVDARGDIKNCPSMRQAYGNVRTTTLGQAAAQPQFAAVGSIAKSQVKVCQDCEFRLVCTDCRAYLEDPADHLSKPLKCGYDPYTAQWADWSTHPLKQPAISFYGLEAAPVEL
jgi:SPASM domain peptide maturase of grasp-with-spasm system